MSPSKKSDKPLAVYVRVSEQGTRDDEEMLSPELQEKRIREWAESHQVRVSTEVFTDIDVSGGKMARKGLDAAMEGVRSKRYGGVVVARLSRFARSLAGGTRVEKSIRLAGGQLVAADFPVDCTTAAGRQMFRTFLGWYEYELDNLREYADETLRTKVMDEGVHGGGGGIPPVGYAFSIVGHTKDGKPIRGPLVRTKQSGYVEDAFNMVSSGLTIGKAADHLNAHGVQTGRGGTWKITNLRERLKDDVYTGVASGGGVLKTDEETGETYRTHLYRNLGAHKRIVSDAVFATVQKRLAPKSPKAPRSHGAGHVLGEGLVRCGLCGGGLSKGQANGNVEHVTLRCNSRGSGHPTVSYGRAEEYLVTTILASFATATATEVGPDQDAAHEEAQARLDRAQTDYDAAKEMLGGFDPPAGSPQVVALAEARARLDDVEKKNGNGVPARVLDLSPEDVRAFFEQLPMSERRDLLRSRVERVVLLADSRGRPVEERLVIEWLE